MSEKEEKVLEMLEKIIAMKKDPDVSEEEVAEYRKEILKLYK